VVEETISVEGSVVDVETVSVVEAGVEVPVEEVVVEGVVVEGVVVEGAAVVVEDVVAEGAAVVEGVVVEGVVVEGAVVVVGVVFVVVEGVVVEGVFVVVEGVGIEAATVPVFPCGRPEDGRFDKACPGVTCTKSSVVLEPSFCFEALTRLFTSEPPVLTTTIFFGRLGKVETYCSVYVRAELKLLPLSTGYCRSIRPIMVSTSPIPEMRRAISSFGFEEKDIK
jgi:hypothetical protein